MADDIRDELDDLEEVGLLLELASHIDDNRPVDWDAAVRTARDDEERAIVSELRVLAESTVLFPQFDPSVPTQGPPAGELAPHPARDANARRCMRWGPLTIEAEIGRGAFGTVYRAKDNLSRDVALKLFSLPVGTPADQAARMRHEGELLARVRHPQVVTVFGAAEHDGRVGLWMELIHGRTLEDELRARGTFGAEEAALIGRDLCRALAAVHAAGLIHRDIKAHNVMRQDGGRTVLMDFGAGRDVRARQSDAPLDAAGTPLYLAPEIFEGAPASEPADIYSLGVLLYRLTTNSYPVDGETRSEIRRRHRQQQRRRLRDARPDLPDGFVQAIERARVCVRSSPWPIPCAGSRKPSAARGCGSSRCRIRSARKTSDSGFGLRV
jgi:eukaryotic-like serine/threonine-protein kinase